MKFQLSLFSIYCSALWLHTSVLVLCSQTSSVNAFNYDSRRLHSKGIRNRAAADNKIGVRIESKLHDSLLSGSTVSRQLGKQVVLLASTAAQATVSGDWKSTLAKGLGLVMGFGAIALFAPIIFKLLKTKDADGFSVQTWIWNLIGMTIAILYPYKKGFHYSTYMELLAIGAQSAGILGLICQYQGKLKEFVTGMAVYVAVTASLFAVPIPAKTLSFLQLFGIIVCNYANVPQIMLTYRKKKASWSPITAVLSMSGNLVRIFTTLQLTQDWLLLSGYLIGFTTNTILFLQVLMYGSA